MFHVQAKAVRPPDHSPLRVSILYTQTGVRIVQFMRYTLEKERERKVFEDKIQVRGAIKHVTGLFSAGE